MGLDSFWKLPEDSKPPQFKEPLRLCGGMLSGSGEGSFRGKVYAGLIETITGESLYKEDISNDTVKKMADALDKTSYADAMKSREANEYGYEIGRAEYGHLQEMFRAYADAGATLHGWW